MADLDDPRGLRRRLTETGRSQAELARHSRLDPSSLGRLIKGARGLKHEEAVAIEDFFAGRSHEGVAGRAGVQIRQSISSSGARKLPVYGYAAAGGEDRIAYAEDRVLDWVDAPPFFSATGNAILVRVVGHSMEPRFFPGEMVPVWLEVPPARGQDCLVLLKDGTALLKTYRTTKDGFVQLEQYNPPGSPLIMLSTGEVEKVHFAGWLR